MRRPTFLDVLRAKKAIDGLIRCTPLERSSSLSEATGADVWVKWENLQVCGSFKVRGALNKMLSLTKDQMRRGVVASSSGNHAQGVAMASHLLGTRALIFVPTHCPVYKRDAIERLGAGWVELRLVGDIFEETEAAAQTFCSANDMVYVSSYHDHLVMAGAGTIALEILVEQPDVEIIVFPAGSGGLINGAATVAKSVSPEIEIWGVQSTASMPWVASWESGEVKKFDYEETLAEGLSGYIKQDMLDLAKTHISGFVGVSERKLVEAVACVFENSHMVIEPSSAVVPAALINRAIPNVNGKKICAVMSGGNADTEIYKRLIQRGAK